jgi:hypothetical protein
MKGFQVYSNVGPSPPQRGIITENKNRVGSFKYMYLLFMNHSIIKAQIDMGAS